MAIEEEIALRHYETGEKIVIKAKRTSKEGEYIAHCINPGHPDKHPSMGINVIKGVYNCISRQDASGITWDKYLEGGSKQDKRSLQKRKEEEIKRDILMAIDTDLLNWSGYDPEIRAEVKTRISFDLCFLPEEERIIAIGALTKAGIFKRPDLLRRIKIVVNRLKGTKLKEEDQTKLKFDPRTYSDKIMEKYPLRFDTLKRFWIYHEKRGLWIEKAEPILNSLLRKSILGEKDHKAYCVREILEE